MRIINLAFSALIISSLSFAQSAKPIDVHGFKKEFELEKLLTPIDIQGQIWQVHAMASDGEYIFVVNDKEIPPIKSYRLKDGKFMGGFGSVGGGPGEFISINRSGFGVRKDKLIVQGRKYVRIYKLNPQGDELDFQLEQEFRIPAEVGILNRAFLLNNDVLAGAVGFSPKQFVAFRLGEGEMGGSKDIGALGDYPNLHPNIPSGTYDQVYQGDSDYSQDGKFLTKIYSSFPLIRVFSLGDGTYNDIELKPKNEQVSKLIPNKDGMNIVNSMDMFRYQGNVEMSNDLVVSDYQEKLYKKVAMTAMGNLKSIPQTDRFLLLFSIEGELLAKFTPPDWFNRFILTPDNKMILFHPEIEDKLFVVNLAQFK